MDVSGFRDRLSSAFRRVPKAGRRGALIGGIVFIVIGLGFAAAAWVTTLLPEFPDRREIWEAGQGQSLVFLDRNRDLAAQRGAIRGDHLTPKDLPPYLVDAFLATEDRRFFRHGGVDPRGILRALVANIAAGRFVQGGSTITQQVAKNLFLSAERTAKRKFQELVLAVWLERQLSKDEILTLYLNRIYFGAGTYGIDGAARKYFGKSAREVTLAEAAMLAALPKAPSRFAPTVDLERAQDRAGHVLTDMVQAGVVSEDAVAEARANPAVPQPQTRDRPVNFFLDHVEEELADLLDTVAPDYSGDLLVTTTLDPAMEKLAAAALIARLDEEGEKSNASQGAIVALAHDGAVRAMVGGRSYAESQFNRAVHARRQPGSAFKPFVYLAALESGRQPTDIETDAPLTVGTWTPENYGRNYAGRVSLAQAFARSLNTVAVRVSEEVGREKVIDVAYRLGIHSDLAPVPSIALGTSEVGLLELTGAYGAFATQGLSVHPYLISKVETPGGGVLYERPPSEPERLVERETAEAMTHLLYQVMHSGTGRAANLGKRPAAGKTGTSQEWRDGWFVGFTGDYITGVWVGNDDDTPMNKVTGGGLPARIWKDFMVGAHEGLAMASLPGAYPARDPVATDSYRIFLGNLAGHLERAGNEQRVVRRPREERRRSWSIFDW